MYGTVSWMRAEPSRLRATDAAVAAALCAFVLIMTVVGPHQARTPLSAWLLMVTIGTCAALPFRRSHPVAALTVTTAGVAVYLARLGYHPPLLIAPLIVLHYIAGTMDRRTALWRGLPAVLVLVVTDALARPSEWFSAQSLAVGAVSLLALAAGDASRSRRDYIAEVEERARRAEHDRENEARRRVTQERLRIARDLHDQVGHHLALINVQAGVADYVLEEQPDQVRESLTHIRHASRAALDELKDTVGLLREAGDAAAPMEPTVGLAGLGELVESFRKSGLKIEHKVDGPARALAPAADLTAYRVVQESLTNVCKHAGSAVASVRLSYHPAALRIVVENGADASRQAPAVAQPGRDGTRIAAGAADPDIASGTGSGHGLRGMRERVAIVGGSLSAGPRSTGGFRVSVMLPLSPDREGVS